MECNRQLPSEFKKQGETAVVGNVNWKSNKAQSSQQNQSAGDHAGGKSIGGRCWFCFETGHRKNDCPMWKSVSKMVEEYDKGTLGGADSASVSMVKERCDRGSSRHCAVSLIEPSSQTDREGVLRIKAILNLITPKPRQKNKLEAPRQRKRIFRKKPHQPQ